MKHIGWWIGGGVLLLTGLIYLVSKNAQGATVPGTGTGSNITLDLSAF